MLSKGCLLCSIKKDFLYWSRLWNQYGVVLKKAIKRIFLTVVSLGGIAPSLLTQLYRSYECNWNTVQSAHLQKSKRKNQNQKYICQLEFYVPFVAGAPFPNSDALNPLLKKPWRSGCPLARMLHELLGYVSLCYVNDWSQNCIFFYAIRLMTDAFLNYFFLKSDSCLVAWWVAAI